MGFFLKKLVGGLLKPLPLSLLFCLFVLWAIWRGHMRTAKAVLATVVTGLYFLSTELVATGITSPLEMAYPQYNNQPVEYVIVLGGGHSSDDRKPVSSLLTSTSLMRLTEGVRVWRQNEGAKLLLSGYGAGDQLTNAEAMARVAQELFNVPEDMIITKIEPQDTADEAAAWFKEIGSRSVALVSTATHMPRAMMLFHQQGMQPVPAPTEFRTLGNHEMTWRSWLPYANLLELSTRAWHEYMGIAWIWLRS